MSIKASFQTLYLLISVCSILIFNISIQAQNQLSIGNLLVYAEDTEDIANGSSSEIFAYDFVSGETYRLTNDDFTDYAPLLSPNQELIVYESIRESGSELYILDLRNNNEIFPLTDNDVYDSDPSWSSDSSQLVFVSEEFKGATSDIYRINVDGSGRINLTNSSRGEADPAWSPVSNQVAFTAVVDGEYEIFIMDSTGSNVAQLTNYGLNPGLLRWSPNGTRLAFKGAFEDIYRIDADGSNLFRILPDYVYDTGSFLWLNNLQIAYFETQDGLVRINVDGTERVPLVFDLDPLGVFSVSPNWTPDIEVSSIFGVYLMDGTYAHLGGSITGIIMPLTDGSVINLSEIDTSTPFIAVQSEPYQVGSVVFELDGQSVVQADSSIPYIFTDWLPTVGSHTLTVIPYAEPEGIGIAGTPTTINLMVIDETP